MQGLLWLLVLTGVGTPSAWARDQAGDPPAEARAATENACNVPHAATAFRLGPRWFEAADGTRQRKGPEAVLPPAVAKRPELAGATTALAVEKGWLVGTERGRRGGELRFVPPRGPSVVLWAATVRTLTVVGAKTLGMADKPDGTDVVEVLRDAKARGGWMARKLVQLPGRELAAFQLSDDRLMVLTTKGATSVGLDGSVRNEPCPEEYLTGEVGAPEAEAAPTTSLRSLPATVSGISEAAVREHLADAVIVLNLVLNHPRVLPFFHLDPSSKARVAQLPAIVPAKEIKIAGRDVEWVPGVPSTVFRFLDLTFETTTAANVAFAHAGEGMEGYVIAAKQDGVWRVMGIHVVER